MKALYFHKPRKQYLLFKKILKQLDALSFDYEDYSSSQVMLLKQLVKAEHYEEMVELFKKEVMTQFWWVLDRNQNAYGSMAYLIAGITFFIVYIGGVFTVLGAHHPKTNWMSYHDSLIFSTFFFAIGVAIFIYLIVRYIKFRRLRRKLKQGGL